MSFSADSLWIYRKAIDFYLEFATCNFVKFISFSSLLVKRLGSSRYRIMSPTNSDNLTTFFPIFISFIFFSFLILLARISTTLLNVGCKTRHP